MTTRQYLNEAALSVTKLLNLVRRMTDKQIDEIMDHDEVGALAKIAQDLHVYAVNTKAYNELKDTS